MKKIRFNGTPKNIVTFSIHITGRCNAACTYCHYYGQRDKKTIWRDLDKELYQTYLCFVKHWTKRVQSKTLLRFSGGDPTVLGEELFPKIDQAYTITGIQPYILTAGKTLDESWIKQAQQSHLSHVFVSIENPLNPDKGAPGPQQTMEAIQRLNSPKLPILPGTMIIKNKDYEHLFKICQIVYEKLGAIPNFSELNYQAYESPTDEELDSLYLNIYRIAMEYAEKCPINIFSYIAPELGYGTTYPYIVDLNLSNTLEICEGKLEEAINTVFHQISHAYRQGDCCHHTCDWSNQCRIVKWMWYESYGRIPVEKKMQDYCRYKKVIMSAFYRVFTGQPSSEWKEGPFYAPTDNSNTPKDLLISGKATTEIAWEKFPETN